MVECWVRETLSSKNRQQAHQNIESSKRVWKDKRLLDKLDLIIKGGDSRKTQEWKWKWKQTVVFENHCLELGFLISLFKI